MDTKSIWIATLATTTAAAAGFGAVMYNKWRTAEGSLEVANNIIQDYKEMEETWKEEAQAYEDHIKAIQDYYDNKDEDTEMELKSISDTLDTEEIKTSTVFEYYDKNIKGTDIGEKLVTKYDEDKAGVEEDMKNDAEEFVNEYRKMVQNIADETGVDIKVERHISYGGHDLAAEEDTSQWKMPELDEIDDDPAWYVEPHKPDKNGRVAPYEINELTYTQDKDYQKEAVFYYPMMERLEDEGGAKVDIDKSISWMALTWFGSDPADPNRVYVRNQEKKIDYEVIQVV